MAWYHRSMVLLGLGLAVFDLQESVLPVPFDPPIVRKVEPNRDPVLLTYTGPGPTRWDRDRYPRHCQAYDKLSSVCTGTLYYTRPTLPPRSFKVDKYGNTSFNLLLMSHVVLEEKEILSLSQQFKTAKLTSLRENKFGQTPLMLAVESGYPPVVEEVLKLKPNLFAKDKDGHDAVDYLLYGTFRADDALMTPGAVVTLWRIGDIAGGLRSGEAACGTSGSGGQASGTGAEVDE